MEFFIGVLFYAAKNFPFSILSSLKIERLRTLNKSHNKKNYTVCLSLNENINILLIPNIVLQKSIPRIHENHESAPLIAKTFNMVHISKALVWP